MSNTSKSNIMSFLERNPDLFKEMGNIGMGHACTALSQILNIKVNRSIPAVWSLTREETEGYLELFEGGSIGVRLTLSEDVGGAIMHVVSFPFAARLIRLFFSDKEMSGIEDIDEMSMSVVQEMTNITTAAFVNSLSAMTGLFIDISTPHFCTNLTTELLPQPSEGQPCSGQHDDSVTASELDKVIVVENRFLVDMGTISSELIFMPHRESLGVIAEKLCQRYGFELPSEL